MTSTIIILLIVCGVAFFIMQKKKAASEEAEKEKQRFVTYDKDELRLENVEAGGLIHVTGVGPEMEDFDVSIIAKHLYDDGGAPWYELEGESPTRKVWLDLEEDDGLELAITLKKMKLRDIGLTKSDLKRIDDKEAGELSYDGVTYYYEDSEEATFYRYGDRSKGESFYYWDFENEAGDKFIGVERWDGGEYEVSYSETIASHQVSVFSLKK